MKKFFSNWQEPISGLPLLLLLCWLAYKIVPRLDPTAGVDGLGFTADIFQTSCLILTVFFWAWYYRHTYSTTEEAERKSNSDEVRVKYPLCFYVVEKLHQLVVVLIVLYCFKR